MRHALLHLCYYATGPESVTKELKVNLHYRLVVHIRVRYEPLLRSCTRYSDVRDPVLCIL